MRILYIDIDSLRPDHLGCYGYHRNTSPHIDRVAAQGVRFDNLYVTDAPCLPSRTALWSGRFGIHNGVVNHGGVASEPFIEGPGRGFESTLGRTGWMRCLRDAGYHTATISPFGERHSAWHWYANFNEVHNTGRGGLESGEEVGPVVMDWLQRRGRDDHWFLHVNLWDPHTPYRAPAELGEPFASDPLPAWYTEQVRTLHWSQPGPHSAQEVNGYDNKSTTFGGDYPRQPVLIDSMDQARRMFDGYDAGVLWSDHWVGQILTKLRELGVDNDTAVIIGADHGENLGELNIYGDHQTADQHTCRVPLIVRWPGVTDTQAGRVDEALHYHFDFAATMIELVGGSVPGNWDGVPFTAALRDGRDEGRDCLVISQAAWAVQRGVRFRHDGGEWLYLRTYHDAHHGYPDDMLFDLTHDPHEQHDVAAERSDLVEHAKALLEDWHDAMMASATHDVDPLQTVMQEGGGLHARIDLPAYLERLKSTGRGDWVEPLAKKHGVSA
ncbi:MAG: sulfatase-like hydrolase/transferase [Phycisphaera sp.]|nr:sulfatase-like hydrolase/transferase [Phycisphaera sp.]